MTFFYCDSYFFSNSCFFDNNLFAKYLLIHQSCELLFLQLRLNSISLTDSSTVVIPFDCVRQFLFLLTMFPNSLSCNNWHSYLTAWRWLCTASFPGRKCLFSSLLSTGELSLALSCYSLSTKVSTVHLFVCFRKNNLFYLFYMFS